MDKLSKQKAVQAIIERTKEAREAADFSQDEISKKLGIERLTYAKYETRSRIPIELLWQFCQECRVSPEYILVGRETGGLSEIEEKFFKAPEHVQKTILDLLGIKNAD